MQDGMQDDAVAQGIDPLALSRSLRSTSMPTVPALEPAHASRTSLHEQLLDLVFDRAPMEWPSSTRTCCSSGATGPGPTSTSTIWASGRSTPPGA